MSLEVVPYAVEHRMVWEACCAEADNATFLHTREFLSYHGDRFEDASLLFFDQSRVVGVLPAARALRNSTQVVSHPGITYGGIVGPGRLGGGRMIEALQLAKDHFRCRGYASFVYKPLPYVYARTPAQDDLYALFRCGAVRIRCDLSCAIDLHCRRTPSERRRRCLKKAQKATTVADGMELLPELWNVVQQNLDREHGARPVHSWEELSLLCERFPENIRLRCAKIGEHVEAGIIFFNTTRVWHAQYIASSDAGYQASALDAVVEQALEDAHRAGVRFFDLGTSNEDEGRVLNEGLYRFKSEFGGGGVAHEHYEMSLS